MRREYSAILKIPSYILISIGFVLLALSICLYLYFFIMPADEYFEENKFSLKGVSIQFNCERNTQTPLFLKFYGNEKAPWIGVLFGREKNVALVFIHPLRYSGDNNFAAFVANEHGFRKAEDLSMPEQLSLRTNFVFTPEEIKFLEYCIAKAYEPKYQT